MFFIFLSVSVCGPPGFWFSHRSVCGIVGQWVSLSACNHMCVHTCLSCWCFLSVCVCFLFCLSGSMTPLCVSVFACRLIIHTLNTGQKQLGLIQQQPVIALCCWSPHIQKHFNTVLWPNTQISWHLCCLLITSGIFFFFLSHNFLSYKLFLAIIRFSLGMFTVHILCTIDEE